MTDEQIIKALKELLEIMLHEGDLQRSSTISNALDLINRQQAEIERLQKIILGFMDEVGTWSNKYDVDISNIHKLPLLAKEDFNIKNKIKSEAIKEFAKKYKEYIKNFTGRFTDGMRFTVNLDAILFAVDFVADKLVKEMTEPVKLEHNSLCETETYMGE